MDGISVLAFDTGGTILDWHSGIVGAFAECGERRGVSHDWHRLTNEYRRRALRRMIGQVDPGFTIDDAHRELLDQLLSETGIVAFIAEDRAAIAELVRVKGLEPPLPYGKQILSLPRLPFRHTRARGVPCNESRADYSQGA
jgi:FMN phosphatase YigB (HAD superfamily)